MAKRRGWYLYGITRAGSLVKDLVEQVDGPVNATIEGTRESDAECVQLVEWADLAAVVRSVSLEEFDAEALGERAANPVWLQAAVRHHNAAIEAIHARQAILPARFGVVFASVEDVTTTLETAHSQLIAHLDRVEGCDEWGVHVYADVQTADRRAAEDPSVSQLREAIASASPGKAYFLRRKLDDQVAAATDRLLADLADSAYEVLQSQAVDANVSPLARSHRSDDELEVLRAALLVRRDRREALLIAAESVSGQALRCECTGPWPPYSFAAPTDGW
jgi:hypothetical protein